MEFLSSYKNFAKQIIFISIKNICRSLLVEWNGALFLQCSLHHLDSSVLSENERQPSDPQVQVSIHLVTWWYTPFSLTPVMRSYDLLNNKFPHTLAISFFKGVINII